MSLLRRLMPDRFILIPTATLIVATAIPATGAALVAMIGLLTSVVLS
ncbi:MAG: hypothetical protein K2P79_11480 [Sphingomonas sp.]|nr:hypothetical protein [Sphingomonas sp.]